MRVDVTVFMAAVYRALVFGYTSHSASVSGSGAGGNRDIVEEVNPHNFRLRHGNGDSYEMFEEYTTGSAKHDMYQGAIFSWGYLTSWEIVVVEILEGAWDGRVP